MNDISLEFFELTMGIVGQQMEKYHEEVKWVLKTNLYTFVIDHVLEGKGSYVLK